MKYWLLKSDPLSYSWHQLVKDGKTFWDGVRNYQARNYLKMMKINDPVLIYHSVMDKEIVGLAKITEEWKPEPGLENSPWVVVEVSAVQSLKKNISLQNIKENSVLQNIPLIRQQRLSVMPLTETEFNCIMNLSEIK